MSPPVGIVRLALIVDDPDALARQALAAGAREIYPVEDQPYGWRVGRVVDPFCVVGAALLIGVVGAALHSGHQTRSSDDGGKRQRP
jgi:hypothetical protein